MRSTAQHRNHEGPPQRPRRPIHIVLVLVLGLVVGITLRIFAADFGYQSPSWEIFQGTQGTDVITGMTEEEGGDPGEPGSGLTQFQLVQKLIDAVAGRRSAEEIYQSIPREQLDGISVDTFQQYVDMIAGSMSGLPTSFVPMALSERDLHVTSMIQNGSSWRELAERSSFLWLETARTPDSGERFAIAIQTNAQRQPYLDQAWVSGCLDIYKFSQIYLQAVHEGNEKLIASMLYSYVGDDSLRQLKVDAILGQRAQYPLPSSLNGRVRSLRVDSLEIERLPSAFATTEGFQGTPPLRLVAAEPGHFVVRDRPIPAVSYDPSVLWTRLSYARSSQSGSAEPEREGSKESEVSTAADGESQTLEATQPETDPATVWKLEDDHTWTRSNRREAVVALRLGSHFSATDAVEAFGPLMGAQTLHSRSSLLAPSEFPPHLLARGGNDESLPTGDETSQPGETTLAPAPPPEIGEADLLLLHFDRVNLLLRDYRYEDETNWQGRVVGIVINGEGYAFGDDRVAGTMAVSSTVQDWLRIDPFCDLDDFRIPTAAGLVLEPVQIPDMSQRNTTREGEAMGGLRLASREDVREGIFEHLQPRTLYSITDRVVVTDPSETPDNNNDGPRREPLSSRPRLPRGHMHGLPH